jgi:hypothetical protein
MNFTIDPEYLTSVTQKTSISPFVNKETLTPDELAEALVYENTSYAISTIDHPEFTKLRESLQCDGYIYVQRGWWNGDEVLKPFTLNGFKFKRGNRFPCAAALGIAIKCAEESGRKSLLL